MFVDHNYSNKRTEHWFSNYVQTACRREEVMWIKTAPNRSLPQIHIRKYYFPKPYSGIVCVQDFPGVNGKILVLKETLKTTELNL